MRFAFYLRFLWPMRTLFFIWHNQPFQWCWKSNEPSILPFRWYFYKWWPMLQEKAKNNKKCGGGGVKNRCARVENLKINFLWQTLYIKTKVKCVVTDIHRKNPHKPDTRGRGVGGGAEGEGRERGGERTGEVLLSCRAFDIIHTPQHTKNKLRLIICHKIRSKKTSLMNKYKWNSVECLIDFFYCCCLVANNQARSPEHIETTLCVVRQDLIFERHTKRVLAMSSGRKVKCVAALVSIPTIFRAKLTWDKPLNFLWAKINYVFISAVQNDWAISMEVKAPTK